MENQTLQLILSEIKGVNSRLDGIDQRLDNLESRMDNLESQMSKLKTQMRSLRKEMKERDDFVLITLDGDYCKLKERVSRLELKVGIS